MGFFLEIDLIIFIMKLIIHILDTFASKIAAINDETADASIGNVTGSNAVNVFLGIGLPWTFASFYWAFKGEQGLKFVFL